MATITSELERFLDFWCHPKSEARFGHIQIPPYRIGGLLETMRQHFQTSKSHMPFFVIPDGEMKIGAGLNLENDEFPSELMSFTKLLSVLRNNRSPSDYDDWKVGYGVEDWNAGEVLPRRSIFVLQLDPAVPADCALALIGLVNWTLWVNRLDQNNRVQLLTISAEKDSDFLSRLVSVAAPGTQVVNLDLAVHGEQDPQSGAIVYDTIDNAGKVANIVASIRNNPEVSRVIVTFDKGFYDELRTGLGDGSGHGEEIHCLSGDVSNLTNLRTGEVADGKPLLIMIDGELPILPLELPSFDELYLVLSDGKVTGPPLWDNATAQIVMRPRNTSRDDRRLQIWWARQPSIRDRHIFATGRGLPAVMENSYVRKRLVENSQLGGFIAAVIDMSSWGVNSSKAITCFARFARQVDDMRRRLTIQAVITNKGPPLPEDEFNRPLPALALSEEEANVFRGVLSLVDYDHRLALLVALEAEPGARSTKVEIAAILKHGPGKLVGRLPSSGKREQRNIERMLQGCQDVNQALSSTGSIWFTLGQFRRARLRHDDGSDDLHNLVYINQPLVTDVDTLIEEINSVLRKAGVDFRDRNTDSLAIGQEEECQVQRDLARAYIYQLAVSHFPGPGQRMVHRFLSTMNPCILARDPKSVMSIIDFYTLISQDEAVFGICHGISSLGTEDSILSKDWTWIPGQVVANWRYENAPGKNICEVLNTGAQY
ncbi:hypothetical protein BKA59DRAFT_505939 [Fusarium tricinctum]|uniref:Uncharacterized protein n=1 Tax=Fusarium tricinctum TaxID=61284 RepID=A0A8K0WJ22_9HYPO|nr:hypothetical protein BKA59DRAFT_505939 [Fusarium tricinctum]